MPAKSPKGGVATAAPLSVTLDGDTFDLHPTFNTVERLNALFGGLKPAFQTVDNMNFKGTVRVIIAASTVHGIREDRVEQLARALWEHPKRSEVLDPVSRLLVLLLNGGKEPDKKDDEDELPPAAGNA
jgi:hypothetical protein